MIWCKWSFACVLVRGPASGGTATYGRESCPVLNATLLSWLELFAMSTPVNAEHVSTAAADGCNSQ